MKEDSLILPENYFARYRHFIGIGLKQVAAWQAVEAELMEEIGLYRFSCIDSLRNGLATESNIIHSKRLTLSRAKRLRVPK